MRKRARMHRERLNVVVKAAKADFANQLVEEGDFLILPAGTLVKSKNSYDLREKSDLMLPIAVTEKADGVVVHDVLFNPRDLERPVTIALEGVVYLDNLIEVGKGFKTPLTVTKDRLPANVTYVYKNRK